MLLKLTRKCVHENTERPLEILGRRFHFSAIDPNDFPEDFY